MLELSSDPVIEALIEALIDALIIILCQLLGGGGGEAENAKEPLGVVASARAFTTHDGLLSDRYASSFSLLLCTFTELSPTLPAAVPAAVDDVLPTTLTPVPVPVPVLMLVLVPIEYPAALAAAAAA